MRHARYFHASKAENRLGIPQQPPLDCPHRQPSFPLLQASDTIYDCQAQKP